MLSQRWGRKKWKYALLKQMYDKWSRNNNKAHFQPNVIFFCLVHFASNNKTYKSRKNVPSVKENSNATTIAGR